MASYPPLKRSQLTDPSLKLYSLKTQRSIKQKHLFANDTKLTILLFNFKCYNHGFKYIESYTRRSLLLLNPLALAFRMDFSQFDILLTNLLTRQLGTFQQNE